MREAAASSAARASALVATLHPCSFSSASVTPAAARARTRRAAPSPRRGAPRRHRLPHVPERAHDRGTQHLRGLKGRREHGVLRLAAAAFHEWRRDRTYANPRRSSFARMLRRSPPPRSTTCTWSRKRSSTASIPSSSQTSSARLEARVDLVRDHAQTHDRPCIRPVDRVAVVTRAAAVLRRGDPRRPRRRRVGVALLARRRSRCLEAHSWSTTPSPVPLRALRASVGQGTARRPVRPRTPLPAALTWTSICPYRSTAAARTPASCAPSARQGAPPPHRRRLDLPGPATRRPVEPRRLVEPRRPGGRQQWPYRPANRGRPRRTGHRQSYGRRPLVGADFDARACGGGSSAGWFTEPGRTRARPGRHQNLDLRDQWVALPGDRVSWCPTTT